MRRNAASISVLALAWALIAWASPASAWDPAARAMLRSDGSTTKGRELPAGAVVVKRGNLLQRALGLRSRPALVVTRDNAAEVLAPKVGQSIVLSTVFDAPKTVPAKVRTTRTFTTFRSAYAPNGPDMLYPPLVGEYLVMTHKQPVVFQELLSPSRLEGKQVRFDSAGGGSHSAYKRSDSVKLKGTLESVHGGALVVRTRSGRSVTLSIDDAVKILVEK